MPLDPWDDRNQHLKEFPDHILLDIARNDAASRAYRLHAVEILVNRKSLKVKHPDLADLVAELEIELDGIEFEYPKPSGPGPMIASITTETMWNDGPLPEPVTCSENPTKICECDGDCPHRPVEIVDIKPEVVVELKKPTKAKAKNVAE